MLVLPGVHVESEPDGFHAQLFEDPQRWSPIRCPRSGEGGDTRECRSNVGLQLAFGQTTCFHGRLDAQRDMQRRAWSWSAMLLAGEVAVFVFILCDIVPANLQGDDASFDIADRDD